MNEMLIDVSTRKFRRSMRLPDGACRAKGAGLSDRRLPGVLSRCRRRG